MKIALQLWSLKDELLTPEWQSNGKLLEVIEKIAAMGYDGIEWALGDLGFTAAEIKAKLDEVGLVVSSAHVPFEKLRDNFDETIAFEKALGNKYVVCPGVGAENGAEWAERIEALTEINKKVEAEGLTFGYHNHAHEFVKFPELGDEYVLDLIYNKVGIAEIDVYWVEKFGLDPATYLAQYAGKTPLVHIKEMDESREKSTVIGSGILDMPGIIAQSKANGAEWLVVEQEEFTKCHLESVEDGLKYLRGVV